MDTRDLLCRACVVLGVLAIVTGGGPGRAAAGDAIDQLRPSIDQVLRILDDPRLKGPAMTQERRAAIRRAIDGAIDFPDAARRALGPYWRERSEAEHTEFVALFRELVTYSYITRVELYAGEKVIYLAESTDGGGATVRTRIVSRQHPDLPVDYRMHRLGGRWLVYDVIVEGVSLVANYRSQFTTIIQTSSHAELVRRIKSRLAELAAPSPAAMVRPRHLAGVLGMAPMLAALARGHGDSEGTDEDSTAAQQGDDLRSAVDLLETLDEVDARRLGVVGASSGASAAMRFVAEDPRVKALVMRSGNASGAELAAWQVHAPTLLIVGALDAPILAVNEKLLARLGGTKRMEIVPGAGHVFEDPATLRRAALTAEWFARHLG